MDGAGHFRTVHRGKCLLIHTVCGICRDHECELFVLQDVVPCELSLEVVRLFILVNEVFTYRVTSVELLLLCEGWGGVVSKLMLFKTEHSIQCRGR